MISMLFCWMVAMRFTNSSDAMTMPYATAVIRSMVIVITRVVSIISTPAFGAHCMRFR
ncbi:MAG: hypothetical protein ACO3R5_10530 [Pseudohongiellaceae bacterium]